MTKSPTVTRRLRDEILAGRYRPGDRLPSERELVQRLGIHRGAIREGLRALAQLGLIEIRPGGARVLPLHEASLDIIGPLLDLHDPPEPQLVDQVLEVHHTLFATAVRLTLERCDDETIRQARALLARIAEARDEAAYFDAEVPLVELMVEACGNLALRLARRALTAQFWNRLQAAGLGLKTPRKLLAPLVRELDRAFETRNAEEGSKLIYSLMRVHREQIVKELERVRARGDQTNERFLGRS
jgi:GntR family transcriptional repressor for pyruvate dehydrogenase complex